MKMTPELAEELRDKHLYSVQGIIQGHAEFARAIESLINQEKDARIAELEKHINFLTQMHDDLAAIHEESLQPAPVSGIPASQSQVSDEQPQYIDMDAVALAYSKCLALGLHNGSMEDASYEWVESEESMRGKPLCYVLKNNCVSVIWHKNKPITGNPVWEIKQAIQGMQTGSGE